MRDYGTGEWDGGDPDCDHRDARRSAERAARRFADGKGSIGQNLTSWTTRDETVKTADCPKGCGARRVDRQLGLEETPDEYVARMVDVFREVRRVLRDDGTLWLNLGDSYASGEIGRHDYTQARKISKATAASSFSERKQQRLSSGLKPKDLCGIPWRVAFALQADGWYLRSDIIWSKPNPMPESVTDRPTKAHEYVFLLSKRPSYFFDQEAVREPHADGGAWIGRQPVVALKENADRNDGGAMPTTANPAGRNVRSVWTIATQPYPEAHFATFPEELARRCILAGSPAGGVVLDPFMGSGTTAHVARLHGRRSVGIELNPEYCALAAKRLAQQSLLTEATA